MSRDITAGVNVIGAGGHAKVVMSVLRALGVKVIGIYDDDPDRRGSELMGVAIKGPVSMLEGADACSAVLAIGDNESRKAIALRMGNLSWVTAVHPVAYVHPSAKLGAGTVVFAGAVIQPDVIVGDHCIVNTGATIDHDCVVGGYAHLAPGVHLSGGVSVGEGVLLGVGSAVVPGVSIGPWTKVGAGGVVVADCPAGQTVGGVPARPIGQNSQR